MIFVLYYFRVMRDQMLQKSPSRRVIFDEAYDIAFERIARKYDSYIPEEGDVEISSLYEDQVREGVAKKLGIRRHAVNPNVVKEAVECAMEEAKDQVEFAKTCSNELHSYLNNAF